MNQKRGIAMSRTLVTSGLGFFGSRAILRLLGSGSEARSMEGSPSRAAEKPVTVDVQEVQPGRPASFIAAAWDQDGDREDAVAGSEFVDDRIRLQE
jgi:hypothetical protein